MNASEKTFVCYLPHPFFLFFLVLVFFASAPLEFLARDQEQIVSVQNEITIL